MSEVKPTPVRWPLDDFDKGYAAAALGEAWESPDFEVDGLPTAKFFLKFYPKGTDGKYKENCALCLHVRDFGEHLTFGLNYEFWIENRESMKLERKWGEHGFRSTRNSGWQHLWTRTKLLDLAKGGSLVVVCNVTPLDPIDAVEWAEHTGPLGVCRKIAANFDAEAFADVEVHVQGRVFKVNKMIVCSGSPIFRNMLTLETKEKDTGVIEIEKVDGDLVELLLRYLYSGKVAGLKDVAARLLPVSDCYEILDLAETCLASLVKNVSLRTVVRDLKLAFAHDHRGVFKRKLAMFARKNFDELVRHPDWTLGFVREYPEIIFEVTVASSS